MYRLLVKVFASGILMVFILFMLPEKTICGTVPEKYPGLFKAIASLKPGDVIDLSKLNIRLDYHEENNYREAGYYYLLFPRNLDIKSTDCEPYKGRFPYLHLNLPLLPEKSPTTFLVISDQPETIKEDNEYIESKGKGSDGLYAMSTAKSGKRMRYLADHKNLSRKAKWLNVYITCDEDTTINVHKKGCSVAIDSVVAGSLADQLSHQVNLSDIREIKSDTPALLGKWGPVRPNDTAVVLYEMTPYKDVTFWTVISDSETAEITSKDELLSLPKLKSLKWKDRRDKLEKLVKKDRFPSRFSRIMDSYIHARGAFQYPDRYCKTEYDYSIGGHWIQAYSAFEYIEGIDELVCDGKPVNTNNRGNYGGFIRLNILLKSMPWGTDSIAVFMVNTSDTLGGMFKTSLNKKSGISLVFNKTGPENRIISQKKALLLWKGPVIKNSELNIQFFSLANTSVRPVYLVIPLPKN